MGEIGDPMLRRAAMAIQSLRKSGEIIVTSKNEKMSTRKEKKGKGLTREQWLAGLEEKRGLVRFGRVSTAYRL